MPTKMPAYLVAVLRFGQLSTFDRIQRLQWFSEERPTLVTDESEDLVCSTIHTAYGEDYEDAIANGQQYVRERYPHLEAFMRTRGAWLEV